MSFGVDIVPGRAEAQAADGRHVSSNPFSKDCCTVFCVQNGSNFVRKTNPAPGTAVHLLHVLTDLYRHGM